VEGRTNCKCSKHAESSHIQGEVYRSYYISECEESELNVWVQTFMEVVVNMLHNIVSTATVGASLYEF